MNKIESDVAIENGWSAFKLPADNNTYEIVASMIARTTFLYLGALRLPFDVIMLSASVAGAADVT